MTSPHPTIPKNEYVITAVRSQGSGGQNVNKVSTKVVLRWNLHQSRVLTPDQKIWVRGKLATRLTSEGDLVLASQRTRSQAKNRQDVIEKLKLLLAHALRRPKQRRRTRRPTAANEQRLEIKKRRSRLKQHRRSSLEPT